MSKHTHFAGTDHRVPEPDSRGYARVVARGCASSRDYFGEFSCDHGYAWSCDDCPVNDHARGMNKDSCMPQGEGADVPNVLFLPSSSQGVRCECIQTGCRAGPGCPHYCAGCKAHIAAIAKATT